MKRWVGLIVMAGLAIGAETASAQGSYPRGGYGAASDLDGPYPDGPYADGPYADAPYARSPYAVLPEGRRSWTSRPYDPRYGDDGPRYGDRRYDEPGDSPAVLPPTAVYGILRDRGYSPLGIPQQRGGVYTISVISPEGNDGRLVIDARSGRILRFLPAYRLGDRTSPEMNVSYGPAGAPPIPGSNGTPGPVAGNPKVAVRTPNVPLPKPLPARAVAPPVQPVAAKPAAGPAPKAADAQASVQQPTAAALVPALPPAIIEAKPSLRPTQDMPAVQGLD